MTGLLGAFFWLRWRLLLNGLRGGRRRDRIEQISRALAFSTPFIVAALSAGSIAGTLTAGLFIGRALAAGAIGPDMLLRTGALVLTFAMGFTIVLAIVSPLQSGPAESTRFLLLPITARAWHALDVVSRLLDPWIALLAPGLLALAAGLLAGGRAWAALVALAGGAAFVALLASLSSLLGRTAAWLLRDRRRSEVVALLVPLVLVMASFVPALLTLTRGDSESAPLPETTAETSAPRGPVDAPLLAIVFPPQAFGRALRDALAAGGPAGGEWLLALAGQTALIFGLSAAVHARMLGTGSDRGRRAARIDRAGFATLPGLGPGASAVAVAQARTTLRSVQGRMAVLLPGPIFAAVAAAALRSPRHEAIQAVAGLHGYLVLAAGALFGLFTMQNVMLNLFGTDRAGLTLQFLLPLDARHLARGKIAGCAIVYGAGVAVSLAAAILASPSGSPWLWFATMAGAAATFLLYSPFAIWLSALLPVYSDLSKLSRTSGGHKAHGAAAFAGMVLVPLLGLPAGIVIGVAGIGFDRPALAFVLACVWLALAALVARPLIDRASRTIPARQENLALVAQGR
jgi:hypothetical protein